MAKRRARKSHLADAINRNVERHPAMRPVWGAIIFILFFFAMVMMFSK